jgi:hypothetical protein
MNGLRDRAARLPRARAQWSITATNKTYAAALCAADKAQKAHVKAEIRRHVAASRPGSRK